VWNRVNIQSYPKMFPKFWFMAVVMLFVYLGLKPRFMKNALLSFVALKKVRCKASNNSHLTLFYMGVNLHPMWNRVKLGPNSLLVVLDNYWKCLPLCLYLCLSFFKLKLTYEFFNYKLKRRIKYSLMCVRPWVAFYGVGWGLSHYFLETPKSSAYITCFFA